MHSIFDKDWRPGYKLTWCELCNTASIYHIECPNNGTSCNSSGCDVCIPVFAEFHKCKTTTSEYLSEYEQLISIKIEQLRKHILESLSQGDSQIDFAKLESQGNLSKIDRELFHVTETYGK